MSHAPIHLYDFKRGPRNSIRSAVQRHFGFIRWIRQPEEWRNGLLYHFLGVNSNRSMVFDILCGEIPEVRALENGTKAPRRPAPRRSVVAGSQGSYKDEELVSVTIPKGAMPGQTIAIMASGGTRRVKATVPAGLKPGDTFLVRLATPINPEPALAVSTAQHPRQATMTTTSPHFGPSLDEWLTPVNEEKKQDWSHHPVPSSTDQPEYHHHQQHRDPPSYAARGFISGREAPAATTASAHDYYHQFSSEQAPKPNEIEIREQPQTTTPRQKFLLVHVPPGMPPGMTLQVEIPGEGRTVAAQVPPGVEAFHVVYTPQLPTTPRQAPQQSTVPQVVVQSTITTKPSTKPQTPPSKPHKEHTERPRDVPPEQVSKPRRKLLLVRVPPDTAQGTTLHVSIPDEPGRILAAVVPPGNLTEFHVSYEPRAPRRTDGQQQQIQYYGGKPVVGATAGEHAYEQYNNTH